MPKKIIYCPDIYLLCCYAQMNKNTYQDTLFCGVRVKYERPLQTLSDIFIDYTPLFFEAWNLNIIHWLCIMLCTSDNGKIAYKDWYVYRTIPKKISGY